jgi:Mg2+-importing ATPase
MKAVSQPPNGYPDGLDTFWTQSPGAICAKLHCRSEGLSSDDAQRRLIQYGPKSDAETRSDSVLRAILRRLLEPLSLILLSAGIVSAATGDTVGGSIIVAILVVSIGLDTVQEGHAVRTADILRRSVALKAEVKRDGGFRQIEVEKVVPGDILRVRAGDIVPADALILQSTARTAGEAALTGEPYPVEKRPGAVNATSPGEASNTLFRGAVAQTGEAIALTVNTGRATVFGAAASALAQVQAPSPFQRDLREFGLVIARLTLGLVVVVLATRVLLGRPVLDSLLFSVALAVGLTPELLPMITTVTLSRGAMRMAARKVIVKRLASIHDLGAMTVLCTDKTGTLTSAEITLARSLDPLGADDPRIARLGAIAAELGGDRGALDAALVRCSTGAAPSSPRFRSILPNHCGAGGFIALDNTRPIDFLLYLSSGRRPTTSRILLCAISASCAQTGRRRSALASPTPTKRMCAFITAKCWIASTSVPPTYSRGGRGDSGRTPGAPPRRRSTSS